MDKSEFYLIFSSFPTVGHMLHPFTLAIPHQPVTLKNECLGMSLKSLMKLGTNYSLRPSVHHQEHTRMEFDTGPTCHPFSGVLRGF